MTAQVTENSSKLRQQENLFEAARQEKNELAKNLVETKDLLAQYKRKSEVRNAKLQRDDDQRLGGKRDEKGLLQFRVATRFAICNRRQYGMAPNRVSKEVGI